MTRLAYPKPKRLTDRGYLQWVRQQPCIVARCWRRAEAHHIVFDGMGKTGSKVDDFYSLPCCDVHHKEAHKSRDEFEKRYGLNLPLLIIRMLGDYIMHLKGE